MSDEQIEVFRLDMALVNLAGELAAQEAATREVQRQFRDQIGREIDLDTTSHGIEGNRALFSRFDIEIDGVEVILENSQEAAT
jgi:hypothetical protein